MTQIRTPRLITADTPDLPPDIAVVQGRDIYEAAIEARLTFMDDPDVTLVAWRMPPSPIPQDAQKMTALQATVHELSSRVKEATWKTQRLLKHSSIFQPFSRDDDPLDRSLKDHFKLIADITGTDTGSLRDWREDTYDFAEAIYDEFNARALTLSMRFKSAACPDYDGLHTDCGLRSHSLRILRVVDGPTTRFYGRDDVAAIRYHRGITSATLKPGAQPWILKPWDVAFVSQNIVHQVPRDAAPDDAKTGRRALEVYDVVSSEEFIASAQRPLLRRLLGRRPAYADLDL